MQILPEEDILEVGGGEKVMCGIALNTWRSRVSPVLDIFGPPSLTLVTDQDLFSVSM